MNSKAFRQAYITAYTAVACAPLIWSMLFYGFGFYVAHRLGRWPIPMRDNTPNGFPIVVEHIVECLGLGLVVLIPLWIVLAIFSISAPFERSAIPPLRICGKRIDLPALIFLAGVSVLIVIGIWDPHHLFDWFLDWRGAVEMLQAYGGGRSIAELRTLVGHLPRNATLPMT